MDGTAKNVKVKSCVRELRGRQREGPVKDSLTCYPEVLPSSGTAMCAQRLLPQK